MSTRTPLPAPSVSRALSTAALVALLALSVAGCDETAEIDAGTPDAGPPPIGLTVTAVETAASVGTSAPRADNHFVIVDLTLEARDEGPLPVAPNAFTLLVNAGMRVNATPSATDDIENGCMSRSVPLGSSASCRAVFETAITDTPTTLEWSDGTRTVTTPIP